MLDITYIMRIVALLWVLTTLLGQFGLLNWLENNLIWLAAVNHKFQKLGVIFEIGPPNFVH